METRVSDLESKIGENFNQQPRQPLLKMEFPRFMASPISIVKSNQVILKLQSFHEEKIQAREKVDELLSQYRPKYKPKSPPCLRPILKKFKKVCDCGKHHGDDSATFRSNPKFQDSFGVFRTTLARENGNVFDLFVKEGKNSVEIPPFLDSGWKKDTAKDLLILGNKVGFQLIVSVGTIKGLQSLKNLDQEALTQISFMGLDHCFTYESSGSHVLQLFEEMSHSCGFCNGDRICDKGGGLSKDKIWKDHSRIFRYETSTILISSCTNESENATAYDKDGTVCLSKFNSMDFLAICELRFVLNAKKKNFLEEAFYCTR
ncbi:hypothetical protein DVH24_028782 [Malus domestica]|uniref:Uncharacterized protein n=1 Tax=Malus domestica TaxID=3750 RepID=A0A498IZZ3_MALDO|nr:hypothetical protein DVH24_028782 [Malus domestica]